MSSSAKAEAALALHRFGMGPRPGSIAAIGTDPRGSLIAELDRPSAGLAAASALPSSSAALRTVADFNAKQQARTIIAKREQDAKRQQMAEASAMVEGAAQGGKEMAEKTAANAVPDPGRSIYLEEAKLRTEAALNADIGLTERLVWFLSNHFCISADKIRSMAGAYERGAIRPCCSTSTTPSRWGRTRSPASIAAVVSTRTSHARPWSCTRSVFAAATPRTTSSASPMC